MILRHLVIGLHNYNIKEVESLEIFKREIKNWICDDCPCRLHLFFINNPFLTLALKIA